ncbi:serine/threonine-protein kinase [Streptomyces sp. NBC_01497]|uniref:serine/threonine-protein kinase n=1 Tax=Streptomyces sp. NBC_01497 TaxID=2903885 RepID=UPI002E3413F4|nr:serine/threonine-protein kinase [Streptomyces sp. NBC_01497]
MGEVFAGRYELVDPIGRGGIGAVWRAWDHRRRRYVAAKVLQQSDAHTLLRFVREQAVRIDHPHVLAPASWAADDDKVLFTMDLVAGGSLAHLIGDYGPLPPGYVCVLLDQLLAGLAAVHAEGIVHRDIKPANVLLEATGTGRPHLRVSDFGISMRKGEPRLTETNYVVGTPGYFAPEQLLGAEPDFPADLFATGLVALYLLEGHKPDAKALVEYFAEHGTPGAPQGVPEPLWQVLAGLLQPDPHARFRTATGARKALAAALELLPADPAAVSDPVEVFDQIGPLPAGFDAKGPGGTGGRSGPDGTGGQGRTGGAGRVPGPASIGGGQATGGGPAPRTSEGTPPVPSTPPAPTAPPVPAFAPTVSPVAATPRPATPTGDPRAPAPTPPDTGPGPLPPAALTATPPSATPATAPAPGPARTPATPPSALAPGATGPASLSDTGSFHLPPPVPVPAPVLAPAPPHAGHPAPLPNEPYAPYEPLAAHPYTPTPLAPERPAARTAARSHAAARRPGPPARVAVPVLLLALACFAVGIWALSGS